MENIQSESIEFLTGGGEMGELIRSMDWSKTPLGPIEQWPQSLRTSVSLCLSSTFPILIAWGPETIQIYNDSYRPICGAKHPESMGQNFRICWETALPVVGDAFSRGQQGEGTYIKDQRMFLDRYGYLEEAFMTFSFAPIRDESGNVGGIFHPITETTDKMLNGRRTQALRDLGAAIGKAKSVQEIGSIIEQKYEDYKLDVPFALMYQLETDKGLASLVSAAGVSQNTRLAPSQIHLDKADNGWPLHEVIEFGLAKQVNDLDTRFENFECGPYAENPTSAIILPVRISGQTELFGFMISGVSARRVLDQEYLNFYELLASTFNTAVSNVYAYEQEQKRAEALAAIDRSKTAFFNNVSHEFRTPLTLMLGPLEDLLQKEELQQDVRTSIEATHRNSLRLLKLVNNLLDYSRVEAGRTQAVYQNVNLCELTIDLASSFHSIIEKAGMALEVDCDIINNATYVDRQMWEKIVLNLLSNAFKYTLEGSIKISLKQEGNFAVLRVKDSGVGIPAKEMPHMFERFHRIENSAGRTHEGTGIGLSLVKELVNLHHGNISVESIENVGSTFTIKIPLGRAHLPTEHISENAKEIDSAAIKGSFIKEAISLLQKDTVSDTNENSFTAIGDISPVSDSSISKETLILIVDDNSDMRNYLRRLLEPFFTIATAINGKDALIEIGKNMPHLVLSDIMMPVMDGKTMLHYIRNHTDTVRLPVIFLSARAGEEARIDGLEAGADDYLVKPFSAAELLTKVRAQIKISKVRGLAEQQLRDLLIKAPVAIAIYRGPNYLIELANERMLQYWGRTAEQTFNTPLFEAIPELLSQGFDKIMDKVYQTGERLVIVEAPVHLVRYGNKETIFINLTIEPLKEETGEISGLLAVAADITDQVTARKEVEEVTDTLTLAMDAAGMGTWKTELATGRMHLSEKARIIYGIPLDEEIFFDRAMELVVPEQRESFKDAVNQAVKSNGSFNEDYQIQPYDGGKKKWLNTSGKVELDNAGKVKFVIGTVLNITEVKEDGLRKDDFIGMVSHEMKTPLTSLNGYAQMLQSRAMKNEDLFTNNVLDKIVNQVKKMSTLINGFLNVSRLESGKIHLHKETFDLIQLIEEVIEETLVSQSSHKVTFNKASSHALINADKDKIGTVLSNLITNAIKYSPNSDEVVLTCNLNANDVLIRIADTGMGIKKHDLKKLFDRYYRVENPETQYISGFGIGLYLSSEIIKRHNGRIWVDSEIQHGSTFYVSLPLSLEI